MLPSIYVIACGGTIAGKGASQEELIGYKAGEIGVQELIDAVPQLSDYARVTGEQFSNIDSGSMTEAMLINLALRVQELVNRANVDGVVITHGTDSMDETAYFLNLTVHTHKPIVIVGAMRPATAISADGPLNLLEAVRLAACKEAGEYGVLQCMNSTICAARFVEKTDTTHVQAFSGGKLGYVGVMQDGKPIFYQKPLRKHTFESEWQVEKGQVLPSVWILYCHTGMSSDLITAAMRNGVQGLIMVGMGHGSIPKYLLPILEKAREQGIVIIRSTRTHGGVVSMSPLWQGTLAADNLSPQKARILLQLALTKTTDPDKIQQWFGEY